MAKQKSPHPCPPSQSYFETRYSSFNTLERRHPAYSTCDREPSHLLNVGAQASCLLDVPTSRRPMFASTSHTRVRLPIILHVQGEHPLRSPTCHPSLLISQRY